MLMWFYVWKPFMINDYLASLSGHCPCGSWDSFFLWELIATWPHKTKWLKDHVTLGVHQHPAKFDGHRRCDNVEIMLLLCHITSRDHVFQEPCDFKGGSFSFYVTTLIRLVTKVIVVAEITCFNFFYEHHLIRCLKGQATLWSGLPHCMWPTCKIWWL